jgi:hypothetical protein
LCVKIPSKSNRFEKKNNRNGAFEPKVRGEEGRRQQEKKLHIFFTFSPSSPLRLKFFHIF